MMCAREKQKSRELKYRVTQILTVDASYGRGISILVETYRYIVEREVGAKHELELRGLLVEAFFDF
jgi:hypothetical protein